MLTWKARPGNWRVVVMNADGTRQVSSDLSIGATIPKLGAIGIGGIGSGILMLIASGVTLYTLARRGR
jgi:hypothetical protein